jgi:hypothetical protein
MQTEQKDELSEGTVEAIKFTEGEAGNQWTTISGVRYATWWDCRRKNVRVGARVWFRPYRAPLWSGTSDVDCAEIVIVANASIGRAA